MAEEDPGTPIKPGDWARVKTGPAAVKLGPKTLRTVGTGTELAVSKVQDGWVQVSLSDGGESVTGWIKGGLVCRLRPRVKIVAPGSVGGAAVPIVAMAKDALSGAGLMGVLGDPPRVIGTLKIEVTGEALSGEYFVGPFGEFSGGKSQTRYTGARVSGTVSLELSGMRHAHRAFSAKVPPAGKVDEKEGLTPDKAPYTLALNSAGSLLDKLREAVRLAASLPEQMPGTPIQDDPANPIRAGDIVVTQFPVTLAPGKPIPAGADLSVEETKAGVARVAFCDGKETVCGEVPLTSVRRVRIRLVVQQSPVMSEVSVEELCEGILRQAGVVPLSRNAAVADGELRVIVDGAAPPVMGKEFLSGKQVACYPKAVVSGSVALARPPRAELRSSFQGEGGSSGGIFLDGSREPRGAPFGDALKDPGSCCSACLLVLSRAYGDRVLVKWLAEKQSFLCQSAAWALGEWAAAERKAPSPQALSALEALAGASRIVTEAASKIEKASTAAAPVVATPKPAVTETREWEIGSVRPWVERHFDFSPGEKGPKIRFGAEVGKDVLVVDLALRPLKAQDNAQEEWEKLVKEKVLSPARDALGERALDLIKPLLPPARQGKFRVFDMDDVKLEIRGHGARSPAFSAWSGELDVFLRPNNNQIILGKAAPGTAWSRAVRTANRFVALIEVGRQANTRLIWELPAQGKIPPGDLRLRLGDSAVDVLPGIKQGTSVPGPTWDTFRVPR